MDARLPDVFCESVVSLLPNARAAGEARRAARHPACGRLKVIWFVLTVGCRWRTSRGNSVAAVKLHGDA